MIECYDMDDEEKIKYICYFLKKQERDDEL